ncbi:MAG: YciI family protein [Chloroflexi bacterium]|nr:YciI family protein [Chloroflexota bacterium]
MKYMLLLYGNQAEMPQFTAEEQQANMQEWFAFNKEAENAGVMLAYNGLLPTVNATTVRVRDSQTFITDGPFAETHETLGGFYVIDVPDLDEALKWAAKVPSVRYGSIEVRPLWSPQA